MGSFKLKNAFYKLSIVVWWRSKTKTRNGKQLGNVTCMQDKWLVFSGMQPDDNGWDTIEE